MDTQVVITCILSSAAAAALLTSIKEIVLWKMNRKAKLEDAGEEKRDKIDDLKDQMKHQEETNNKILNILDILEKKLDVNSESSRLILKDRIKFIAISFIRERSISIEDRKSIHEMWKLYHYGLGGNGDLDPLMKMIDELPLDLEKENKEA